jgi:sulfur carrier protein
MSTGIRVNGKEEQLQATTVAELLAARGILRAKGIAVAVNGAVVPASSWDRARLVSGDQVEIVKPFGGG